MVAEAVVFVGALTVIMSGMAFLAFMLAAIHDGLSSHDRDGQEK